MPEISIVPFQWRQSEPEGVYGEGVSRPRHGSKTREFRLIIYPQGSQPMTWITRAESQKHALRYAQNRWPGATVEVA